MDSASANNFVVDTEGQCFFCLSQFLSSFSPKHVSEQGISFDSYKSIQCFSRYLGMDMRKVFNEKETIPPALLSKVERSMLKVELCEDCATTIRKFSILYKQLEKIEIEMSYYLNHIQEKLLNGEDGKMTKFNSTGEVKGKQEIVEVLRTESLQKCSSRLRKSAPWVGVQNLSTAQLNAKMKKKQEPPPPNTVFSTQGALSISSNSEQRWGSGSDIKLEGYVFEQIPMEEEDIHNYSDNDNEQFQNDVDVEDGGPDVSFKEGVRRQRQCSLSGDNQHRKVRVRGSSVTTTSPSKTSNSNAGLESIFLDPKTGKHKCGVCKKDFSSKQAAQVHYHSIHQKVKYKCRLCGQKFTRKSSYDRHHQGVHMGVRFKCGICNKMFSQKFLLSLHQVNAHKKGFPCKFCSESFPSRNVLSVHLKGNCKLKGQTSNLS